MAKTAMKVKQQRKQKFSTREYNRCRICGRPHAYLRKYGAGPPAGHCAGMDSNPGTLASEGVVIL